MTGRSATIGHRRERLIHNAHLRSFWRWLVAGSFWLFRRTAGFALAYAALALSILGVFRDPGRSGSQQFLALGGLCIVMLARLFERLQRQESARGRRGTWSDLELGTLFIAGAFVLIELTGGPVGLLYPLIYVLIAFLVAFHGLGLSIYFLAIILGTELAIMLLEPGAADLRLYVSHASFVLLIGFLYTLFLRGETFGRRFNLDNAIASRLKAIESEAEGYRLTSGLSFEGRDLNAKELRRLRRIGSVQAIQESLYNVLAVAERALQPHTVALLWMDADDRRLRVKELRSQSDGIIEKPIPTGVGLVGAITKRREPLVLSGLKGAHPGLVYYRHPESVTDFAGVPVCEGQHLRGVLVADRKGDHPFNDDDVGVLTTIASEIVRAVQVERIFGEMDTEKYQRERFYEASRAFNQALTVDGVSQVAIKAIQRVADAELAAVVVTIPERDGIMRVRAVEADDPAQAEAVRDHIFAAEDGLIGSAIKARHPLPHGTARTESQRIFDAACDIGQEHVKILPLLWKNTGVGALVLASSRPDFLPLDLVDMLRVVADHAAIAIANAQMYERMERMATTDGLTGLVNHRHFQELFDNHLARAERYFRKLSLVMLDIDHFKSINDTYGHPVGDQVLKKVAAQLGQNARKTDDVARYGGEEFAVLLDETGLKGAVQIAERIRSTVAAVELRAENGLFNCTISAGVATYPDDAKTKAALIDAADKALYEAKRRGRNQVVTASSL